MAGHLDSNVYCTKVRAVIKWMALKKGTIETTNYSPYWRQKLFIFHKRRIVGESHWNFIDRIFTDEGDLNYSQKYNFKATNYSSQRYLIHRFTSHENIDIVHAWLCYAVVSFFRFYPCFSGLLHCYGRFPQCPWNNLEEYHWINPMNTQECGIYPQNGATKLCAYFMESTVFQFDEHPFFREYLPAAVNWYVCW